MLKQCIIYLLVSLVILGGMLALAQIVKAPITVKEAEAAEDHIRDIKEMVERDDIDRVMEILRACESGGNDKAIHLNDGAPGRHSYGRYQWQLASAWHYNQIYGILPDLEKNELLNVIYEPTFQDKLTKAVIKDGGWANWKNCLSPYFK